MQAAAAKTGGVACIKAGGENDIVTAAAAIRNDSVAAMAAAWRISIGGEETSINGLKATWHRIVADNISVS